MKIKNSQKIRIICNGVNFYTTKKQIVEGVGSSSEFSFSLKAVLDTVEEKGCNGLGCKIGIFQIQMDLI